MAAVNKSKAEDGVPWWVDKEGCFLFIYQKQRTLEQRKAAAKYGTIKCPQKTSSMSHCCEPYCRCACVVPVSVQSSESWEKAIWFESLHPSCPYCTATPVDEEWRSHRTSCGHHKQWAGKSAVIIQWWHAPYCITSTYRIVVSEYRHLFTWRNPLWTIRGMWFHWWIHWIAYIALQSCWPTWLFFAYCPHTKESTEHRPLVK